MKKISILLFSVLTALSCISAFIIINTSRMNEAVKGEYKAITYKNVLLRNENKRVMAYLLKKDAIAVLGSSELGSSDTVAYPPYLFDGGNSNFNTILIGGSHNQSLFHALLAGAYSDIIPNKKLVFIISPQWFTKEGNPPEAFASRF